MNKENIMQDRSNFMQGAWCCGVLINLYKECEVIGNIYESLIWEIEKVDFCH